MDSHAAHGHDEGHASSYSSLGLVLAALLFLTGVTVWVSRLDFHGFHWLHIWVSVAVASTKGALVLWYFMHLKFEPRLIRWALLAAVVTLALLIGLTFTDYSFR